MSEGTRARARVGYLCSEFPALSHTFISREISVLEKEGFDIRTASVNAPTNVEKMGPEDRAYAARTYAIKKTPKPRIVETLALYALGRGRFFAALACAIRTVALSGPRSTRKALGYFVEAVLLREWARREGLRHVHVHFANPAASVALIAAKLGGLEFSLSVHGPDEFYDVTPNNVKEKIEEAVFVRCIGFFCRSQLMRLSSMDQWGKFHIVRCGIFRDEFARKAPPGGPVRNVLCVGRLCPSKGQAVLVEAAEILRRRKRGFRIRLLGGGPDLEAIRAMIEAKGLGDCVEAVGPVGHDRVKEELAASDLFVLPSFAEGIPVALMEAMASGVPVISTRIAGIPELIDSGSEGVLTQPSDAQELAAAIDSFILGRADARAMTERAWQKVRALFDAEANAKALGELFLAVGGLS